MIAEHATRTALLDAATNLIEEQGFCAFSYADLSERVGIRKPSIHHHFPAKADLGVAVVQRLHAGMAQFWADLERQHPQVPSRIRALFAAIAAKAECRTHICPIGALQSEFNAVPDAVQVEVTRFSEAYLATWSRWLEEGRRSGDLVFAGTARSMAQVLVCSIQAGLQRSRANPEESMAALLNQLERLVGL